MEQFDMIAISSPEIINLQPNEINPYMCSCDIRICYTGKNRNGSYFSKETLIEMSKSLRGSPIVGAFNNDINDFTDHGQEIVIDEDGIQVKWNTVPYGFVAPDASVWFQSFKETDLKTGEVIDREYLMTTGYLWVKQFDAVKSIIDKGIKGQSMEIDGDSLQGSFTELADGKSIFIVTDANFTKLCILGDEVEPCFETAAIIPKEITSYNYTKIKETDINNKFTQTLYSMMQELKTILNNEGGGEQVEKTEKKENTEVETKFEETPETPVSSTGLTEEKQSTVDFKKDEDDKEDDIDDNKRQDEVNESDNDEEKEKKKTYTSNTSEKDDTEVNVLKNQLADITNKYQALQLEFEQLSSKCKELSDFQLKIMDEKKDELINKFYLLSDEEKKDVIENKTKYSLEEIESKLSIIYTRNCLEAEKKQETEKEDVAMTYNLQEQADSVPGYISALRARKK